MFENLDKNIYIKNQIKEINHKEKPFDEKISNISSEKRLNENNQNIIDDFPMNLNLNIMKIKRIDDSFDKFQNKNKSPIANIKEIPPYCQQLMENQSNFSNHFSKNFVLIKENIQNQNGENKTLKEIIEIPLRINDIDKDINPYDSIQYKKLISKKEETKADADTHAEADTGLATKKEKDYENIKFIINKFKINYENELIELIDLTNINKILGKSDLENFSKELSKEAEKYKCTEFKLMSKCLSLRSIRAFSQFFLNCNNLKFLDLSESSIGDVECKYLSEAFLKSKNISEINLQKNMIGDIGAEIIANCIKVNKNITKIELEHNLIGNFGGKKLLESLKENNKIKWVNLFGNNCLDNNIISLISELLRTNRISNRPKKIKQNN
jgi:hypothetical protein